MINRRRNAYLETHPTTTSLIYTLYGFSVTHIILFLCSPPGILNICGASTHSGGGNHFILTE